MKVRASVLNAVGAPRPYAASRPLAVEELDLAGPGPGEVLVAILAAGLCHSDLSAIDGTRPRERTKLPIVLGHEAVGEVVDVGAGVADLARGDRVVTTFVPSCGRCVPCMSGRPALCEAAPALSAAGALATGGTRLSLRGAPVHHYVGVAAFAEMAVLARASLVRIDADIPVAAAAILGCAVLTGVGAVVNTARLAPGQSAAVVGLGGVGLSAVLGAKLAGAAPVIAVDVHEHKRRHALAMGADLAFDAGDPECAARVREATGGGVDFAFETAGSRGALEIAYRATRRGGTTVVAGLPPADVAVPIGHASLVAEERVVKGSYFGSAVPVRDVPRLARLVRDGLLPVDRIAGETVGLDDLNEAFDALAGGTPLRQVLVPGSRAREPRSGSRPA